VKESISLNLASTSSLLQTVMSGAKEELQLVIGWRSSVLETASENWYLAASLQGLTVGSNTVFDARNEGNGAI
jgi:hypothetical protein